MNKHLNYDGNQANGIVFNDAYTWGALYKGAEFKPNLSFEFDSMQATEVFNTGSYVILNGIKRPMTNEEKVEVLALAVSWVQQAEQEGGTIWMQEKLEREELAERMRIVCIEALINDGFTEAQVALFFPQV